MLPDDEEEEEDDEEDAGESTDKAVRADEPSSSVACAAARFFPRLRAFAAAAADIFSNVEERGVQPYLSQHTSKKSRGFFRRPFSILAHVEQQKDGHRGV